MKMKIKKLVILAVCLLIALICYGCGTNPQQPKLAYNAELIIQYSEYERRPIPTDIGDFSHNFWRENMVQSYYFNEDYDLDSSSSKEYIFDDTLPKSILHIVTDEKKYNYIFNKSYKYKNDGKINFEKEMLIVYVYVGHGGIKHSLTEVSLDNKDLTIKYRSKAVTNDATTDPKRRVMVVKLDKLDIETVNFV